MRRQKQELNLKGKIRRIGKQLELLRRDEKKLEPLRKVKKFPATPLA